MHEAARIIRDEHSSLGAVLHGLRELAHDYAEHRTTPDFRVLRAMIDYIVAFPEKVHHPKEDQYLFSAMRARSMEVGPILDQLQAEHVQGDQLIGLLQDALLIFENTGIYGARTFCKIVDEYTDFQWRHMRREEEIVLPLAEEVLTEADWQILARVFKENDDPLFGLKPKEVLARLFQRIVDMTPAPIGVGPAIRKAG